MKKSIITLLIIAMLACIGLVSCKNEIQAPAEELVSVSFDNDSSRSLSSSLEGFAPETYYWKYAAQKADSSNLISGQTADYGSTDSAARQAGARWIKEGQPGFGTGTGDNFVSFKVPGFSQGLWNFTLYGYKWFDLDEDEEKDTNEFVLVYSGEATNVLIKQDGNHTVSAVVSPAQSGTGTLVVEISNIALNPITANGTIAADILLIVEKIGVSTPIFSEKVSEDYTNSQLAAGKYKVTVKFYQAGGNLSNTDTVIYASESVVATVYPGLTTTITGSLTEVVTYADFKAHVHNYVIQSDGEWKCSECSYVLDGTDEAYITVIQNAQPTEIIPLTSETTEPVEVGSNGATVTVSGNVVTYTNAGDSPVAQEVVIRTTSAGTTLTIDAPNDVVRHYDSLGALNIIKSATSSYHENGKVAYAEIAKGRIVLESGAKVEEIHVNKKTDSSFDTVIIANNGGSEELPDRITRDAVSVEIKTLVVVVESNDSSEEVFVYANGVIGTTEKVTEGENKQNEDVNSALGQLVLDNGGQAGEKAQTEQQKSEAKQEAVEEAVIEEIEADDKYVARIGTTPFESLKDAVAAAVANDTIEMTADDSNTETVSIDKVVTIRMNDKTFGGTIKVDTTGTNAVTVVGQANVDAITKLGNRYFNNLVFANNATVTLLKDTTTSQIYKHETSGNGARNWTLDLGGHTITATYDNSEGAIYIGSYYGTNHTLTLRNGNLNLTGSSSSAVGIHVYGNLVLEDINVTSACGTAIKTEAGNWDGPGNVTMANCVIDSQGKGLDLESYKSGNTIKQSTASLSDVTINATNIAVYSNGSICIIDNCSINSTASHAIQTVSSGMASGSAPSVVISGTGSITSQNENTIDCKGGTLSISGNMNISGSNTVVYSQSSAVTISGGNYVGSFRLGASGQITVTGGTFDHDPSAYVAEGYYAKYHPAAGTDPKYWTVEEVPSDAVFALINNATSEVTYIKGSEIQSSISGFANGTAPVGVQSNHTLRLLKSFEHVIDGSQPGDLIYFVGDDITFDLNSFTYTISAENIMYVFGSIDTIKNFTIKNGSITSKYNTRYLFISNSKPDETEVNSLNVEYQNIYEPWHWKEMTSH